MDKKIRKFVKHHIAMIWIVAVCFALTYMIVMAAYPTKQNKAKKIVSLQSEAEVQFSSNYLEEDVLYKTVVINDTDPITVDIRNYGKNNSTKWYSSDISFTLVAELTDSSGKTITDNLLIGSDNVIVKKVVVEENEGVENTWEEVVFTLNATDPTDSKTQSLKHSSGAKTTQSYKIYFPSASSKVCLKMTAIPDDIHNDLRTIGAILAVSDKSSIQSDGWTGQFNDPTSKAPTEYDAFNYAITGHGDSNSATIKWNADVITLNKMYIKDNFNVEITSASDVTGRSGWKQITISIRDDDNNGQYSFQVFKADKFNLSSWEELQACIEFDDGI